MHLISVDFGSYSIKIIHSMVTKGTPQLLNYEEYPLVDYLDLALAPELVYKDQILLLKKFLSRINYEHKLILSIQNDFFTTRQLTIPIKNKKKAHLMIPFQLEEEIPYSLSEAHIGTSLNDTDEGYNALISLIKKEFFEYKFDIIKNQRLNPYMMTSQVSIYDFYFRNHFEAVENFCILDIGHQMTNAYFFFNSRLVSSHKTYVGGKHIDEEIIQHYKVNEEEARIFKHKNAFVLTENQIAKADQNQKIFSNIMSKLFEPLIADFKRWELGYQVRQRVGITKIYLTGGTSRIKNLNNYLSQSLGYPAYYLNSFNDSKTNHFNLSQNEVSLFNLVHMLSHTYPNRKKCINMLNGEYTLQGSNNISLYNSTFVSTRILYFCLLISAYLGVNLYLTEIKIKTANTHLTSLYNNQTISHLFSKATKNTSKRKPKLALPTVKRKKKSAVQSL
ncbi:pilus assembly protein PilM, partial [Bacteriovoracaceae bacterium]|nr:pilus assembly protein PilM [Bacteriovoracaceae bacterium]